MGSSEAALIADERERDLDLLRSTARSFFASAPLADRAELERPRVLDRALWRSGVELGWIAAATPSELGGAAVDALDLAVFTEEVGRALYGGPYFGSVLAAAVAVRCSSDAAKELTASLDSGDTTACWCASPPDRTGDTLVAHPDGERCRLDGSLGFVLDADLAERLLVTAEAEDGEKILAVAERSDPTVTVVELDALDLTRRLSTVRFDETWATTIATGDEAAASQRYGDELGALLACADSVGCGDRLVELTVEYAQQRVAFGKPIAHYQAVKHKCADMLYWLESSRVTTHHAARQTDSAAFALAVGRAKSLAGEACSRLAGESLQIHGGIGFTWEHDLHLYLRRIKTNEVVFGDPAWHRHRIAPELN